MDFVEEYGEDVGWKMEVEADLTESQQAELDRRVEVDDEYRRIFGPTKAQAREWINDVTSRRPIAEY